MIITKDELNVKLKTKYASRGLRKEALIKLTDIVYSQITEESTDEEIETFISGVEPYVSILQSEVDFAKTRKSKTKESGEQQENDSTEPIQKEDGGDQTPLWAKKLVDRLDKLEGEKISSTRKSQLEKALEGLTDDQKRGYSRIKLDSFSNEEFQAEMDAITTETENLRTENAKRGVVITPPRVNNNPSAKEASTKEVSDLADTFNI